MSTRGAQDPGAPWAVGVVIPARNEELTIADCLSAVRAALAACSPLHASWITVVADSCNDNTVAAAAAALENEGDVIECAEASAGAARRLGTRHVLERLADAPAERIWVANTDADSAPHSDWLLQQLRLARQGYCAVAGIVQLSGAEPPEVVNAYSRDYALYSDGSHPHIHGANLGIRADAYLHAGGWSDAALAEDLCLWRRVRAHNWPTVASIASVVTTSGRLFGRAQGGFADTLRLRVESLYA
jgi:glycosyltransferase involved in cell wall biosynthesis